MTGRPRPCRAIENDQRCPQPGTYRAWLRDCTACWNAFGATTCHGHHFCGWHAAVAGFGLGEHDSDGSDLIVTRMTESEAAA